MERVIVNEGTKVNLFQLFEDLQNDTQLNSLRIFETLVETFGINVLTNLDGSVASSDTSLKVGPGAGGAGGGGYVTVEAGDAITGNLSWIGVTSQTPVSTQGMSLGLHTLYLAQAYTYDTPVDVLSGFAFSLAGGTQKNSRAHDTFVFYWDFNPVLSGVVLADVTVGASSNTVTTDRRYQNVLMLKSSVIPSEVFIGNQASSAGAPVQPKNFRITNLSASTKSSAADPSLLNNASSQVSAGLPSNEIAVDVAWNWDNVSWSAYTGQDQIIVSLNPGQQTVITNELVNYHIWHPYGYDFLITANTAGGTGTGGPIIITTTPFGTNTTHINSLPPANAGGVIHSNAASYDILTIPVAQDGVSYNLSERYEDRINAPVDGRSGPVILKTKLYIFQSEHVLFQIRSLGPLGQASAYTVMPAGLFTSRVFLSPVSYTSPFIAKLPFVDDNGTTVKAVGQAGGFVVTITPPATGGWALGNVDGYEVIWASTLDGLVFDARESSSQSALGTTTTITVPFPTTTSATTLFVKVRPIIGGMGVSDGIIANGGGSIVVGSTTEVPTWTVPITAPRTLKSFSGTLLGPTAVTSSVIATATASSFTQPPINPTVTVYYWTISGLVSPAFSSNLAITAKNIFEQIGSQLVLTYSGVTLGHYYTIDSAVDQGQAIPGVPSQTAVVLKYSSLSDPALVNQFVQTALPYNNFIANWDQNSRVLYVSPSDPGFDFVITQLTVDYSALLGDATSLAAGHLPVIRIYNGANNGPNYGFSAVLPQPTANTGGTLTYDNINVICSIIQGASAPSGASGPGGRTVIIDLYNPADPLGPSNAVGINWKNGITYTYKALK